jgi:hypothetical protein
MTAEHFLASLSKPAPPAGLSGELAALWWLRKGDWTAAHELVQALDSADAAWIHAHLHRVEGDGDNAAYWYRRAAQPIATVPTTDEWQAILAALLSR